VVHADILCTLDSDPDSVARERRPRKSQKPRELCNIGTPGHHDFPLKFAIRGKGRILLPNKRREWQVKYATTERNVQRE